MLVSSFAHCTAVLLFQLWQVQTFSPISACPASCTCDKTLLVNCSSLALPKAPSHIPATATALDLSHNALQTLAPLASGHMYLRGLQHLWVGNNSLESLSMCWRIQGNMGTRTLTRRNQKCVSWTPDLELLSADRNQLKCLPKGLGKMKSLKVLKLSHNRISKIGPADLTGCTHLNELHLQYNLINMIHPKAFEDLPNLKVLDVSHNLLVTIPVQAYLSLRNMNLLVDISGNRWKCDCSLKTIRRWLSVDDELDNFPTWKIMCFSPHHHAGKDLLYLEESELTCPQPVYSSPGVRKEVTVGEGIDIILSCSTANQDFLHTRWWTPHGHISDSQKFLHITNITENDAGLYVCVSGYHEEHVSVFSLHVHRGAHASRLRREAQIGLVEFNAEDNHNIKRNVPAVRNVQQSQFDLAVCLSVIITFIVAFILGVILRPFLEKWYKQIRNKKKSTTSPPNSQTAQSPYVNEGYSDTGDQEQAVYEGPRVTFGGVTEIHEQGSVPYYVTVEGSPPESNIDDAALQVQADRVLVKNIGVHKEVPLREENNEMTSIGSTDMQFENIPDPEDAAELEERSISPASFFSDEQQDSQMSHEGKESIEQRVLASTDKGETIPGFITDPFPLKMSETKEESVDELDPDLWNDSGESFSFTEGSQRSSSPASHVASFGHPLFEKQMSVDEPSDRPNSYNLGESGESKVGYTVNSEDIKDFSSEDNILTDDQKTDKGNRLRQDTITLDPTDIRMTYIRGDSLDDEPFTGYKEYFPFSNISTVFEEPAQYNVHPVYRTSLKTTSLSGEEMISESDRSHVGFSLDDSIFGVIDQTLDPITRIKQYIHFSQSQSYPQIQAPCYSTKEEIIPNKVIKTELKKISSENNFFVQIDASLDDLPKVKQYIQFSPSGSQLSTSAAPINQVATSVVVSKPESMSDTINIFYEGQTTPLPAMPKVQRYVLFSQSEPQTVHEHTLNVQEESFFGQVPISFDEVPKIKQHVQFSPSDLQHSTDSTLSESVHKVSRPVVVSKTDYPSDTISISYKGQNISLQTMPEVPRYVQFRQSDPQSVIRHTSTIQGDSLFEQIPISIDKLAKVKRYVEFAPFKSQLPNDPVYSESIHQVARPVVVSKTELPSDKISIFYKGQNIAIQTMPKVQRHVQFRESGPQMVHGHTPDIQGNWFFGRIPITFDEVPKVKHYVQFSPFKSQLPNDSGNSESIHGVARPVVRSKMELPSDTISIFYKGQNIAIQTMPKVQRYVQFRQSEPQTVQEWTPAIQGSSFFEQIPISFDKVPKIKQYVQFSPSESQVSTDTVHHYITSPEMFSKTESSSGTINIFYEGQTISLPAMAKVQRYVQFRQFKPQTVHEHTPEIQANWFFGQIPIVVGDVPKVKRHILFSQSTQTSLPYSPSKKKKSLNDEQITHEIKTPLVTSKPQNSGDNFFVQTGTCLDRVPKVKRYIQFTQSKVIPKTHNVLSKLNKTTQEDIVVKRNKPLSNYDDPVNKHIFFKQTGVIFDGIPKVKRIIQFTEHPPQPPESQPLSLLEQPVTPALILHAKPSQSKPNFFEISLENIPKVNRSLQFIQVEAEPSNQPIPSLSGKIHTSFDKVPKVKRYLQFINSETQPSSLPPLPSKITDTVTPAFSTKTQTTRSEEKGCSTIKEDDFFGQTVSTFNELPKVKRYIQFTQAQPRLPPSPMHSLSNRANKIIHARPELMVKDSTSVDYIQPAAGEQNILGPIGASFEVPKVRRYIQFSQNSTQPSLPSSLQETARPVLTKQELWRSSSSLADSKSNTEDTFFKKTDSSELPKVKRYIQFTHQHSALSKSSNNRGVTDDAAKKTEFGGSDLSRVEIKPPVTEDSFLLAAAGEQNILGPIGASFEVPKVRRYIQFSQNSTQPSLPSSLQETARPVLTKQELWRSSSSLADSKSNTEDTFFKKTDSSELPKVKRYIQFTHQHSALSKSSNNRGVTDDAAKKTEFGGSDLSRVEIKPPVTEDSFLLAAAGKQNILGPIGASFEIPKVRRYIQFSQNSTQPSLPSSLQETARPVLTKQELWRSSSSLADSKSNTEDTFFKKTDGSELPKVKRYIQFTHQHSALSNSPNNRSVTDDVAKKTEFEHPVTEDKYFGQLETNLNSPLRVNRYIKFTHSEPYTSHQSQSQTEKIIKKEWETVNSPVDIDTKLNTKDTLFDGVFDSLPKVKKSLLFTQSKAEKSNLTEVQQKIVPQLLLKTVRPSSIFDEDDVLKKEDDYLGQVGVLLDEVPKVKKYVQFSQSEVSAPPQTSLNIQDHSSLPFSKAETVTPVLATKTDSNSADYSFEKKDRTDTSFNEFPKVQRYLQFTKSEPEPLAQSTLTTDVVSPAFSTNMQTTKSKDKESPLIRADDFFGQTVSSFNEVPKVKRYVQFTQTEPHLQPPLLHSLSNITDKKIHTSSELNLKDFASKDYIQPAAGKHDLLGPVGTSFDIPKVRKYIQFSQGQTQTPIEKMTEKAPLFTQSEYQRQTAGDTSSNDTNTAFGSLDVSFNQLPNVKRNVQSEPYLSTEEVFKLSTKKNDLFGQTDGVPKLIRYRQHMESKPYNQSPSLSPKRKMMDVEVTESRMFTTSVTPETTKDFSWIQEAPSAVKVTTETSRLHQRPQLLLNADVYNQPAVEEVFIPTSSDKKYANTQGLDNRSTSESKLFSLGASSHESSALQTRKPLFLDHELQDLSQYITDKPAAFSEKDAREYLRESSLARQRQERRKMLFQQKKRAMDGFSLTSESFTSYESDQ